MALYDISYLVYFSSRSIRFVFSFSELVSAFTITALFLLPTYVRRAAACEPERLRSIHTICSCDPPVIHVASP